MKQREANAYEGGRVMTETLCDPLVIAIRIAIREWIPVPARTGIVLDVGGEPSAERQRLADRAADAALAVLREWPDAAEVAALVRVRTAIESVSGATAVRFTSRFTPSTETWLRGCIVRAPQGGENAEG